MRAEQHRRDALVRARRDVSERIADLRGDVEAIAEATEGAPDDEHDAEGSTVGFERARVASLLLRADHAAAGLDAAIARFDAGTYGRCAVCGAVIPDERLDALPSTTRCIACAS